MTRTDSSSYGKKKKDREGESRDWLLLLPLRISTYSDQDPVDVPSFQVESQQKPYAGLAGMKQLSRRKVYSECLSEVLKAMPNSTFITRPGLHYNLSILFTPLSSLLHTPLLAINLIFNDVTL